MSAGKYSNVNESQTRHNNFNDNLEGYGRFYKI